jgi:hypothetical protein
MEEAAVDYTIQKLDTLWKDKLALIVGVKGVVEVVDDAPAVIIDPSSSNNSSSTTTISAYSACTNPYEQRVKLEPNTSNRKRKVESSPKPNPPQHTTSSAAVKTEQAKKKTKKEDEDEEDVEVEVDDGLSDESALGSDLDDDNDMDPETDNICVCQYTRVNRTKSRWRCVFKDGILRVRGQMYLFKECSGDFNF